MKHVFVFDPKAFHNQQWKMENILDNIGQFFRTQEKPDFSIQMSRYRRHAITLIQQELNKGNHSDTVRVYAIGGEEILYDCLNAVIHFPNMQLAIVPYIDSCDFINIFGENKTEIFKDIPSLVNAKTLPTDVIRWGVNYALNSCYIGLNIAVTSKLKGLKSRLGKRSFLFFSKVLSFFSYIKTIFDKQIFAQQYVITIDDKDCSGNYSFVHVANSPYYDGKKTGASVAGVDDGFLDITLIKATGPIRTVLSMKKYLNGKRNKHCVSFQAKKISIQSERRMWIQIDNEYIMDTNLEMNVVHHAVEIAVPDGAAYPSALIPGV